MNKARKASLSFEELKGKQSVRATFRLPPQVIDLLSLIASQLNIKQKTLIDQLVADPSALGQVAREARLDGSGHPAQRRQKTFVMSRSSLDLLDSMARREKVPRDALVEYSILRLQPVIESEQHRHEQRKILLNDMRQYLGEGRKIRDRAVTMLGREDRVCRMLELYVRQGEENVAHLAAMVEKGRPMEDW